MRSLAKKKTSDYEVYVINYLVVLVELNIKEIDVNLKKEYRERK